MAEIIWDRITAGFTRLHIRKQIADYAADMGLLTSKTAPELDPAGEGAELDQMLKSAFAMTEAEADRYEEAKDWIFGGLGPDDFNDAAIAMRFPERCEASIPEEWFSEMVLFCDDDDVPPGISMQIEAVRTQRKRMWRARGYAEGVRAALARRAAPKPFAA